MRINELESQIAFQIKPIVQTQQQTIEFYKTRIQYLNLHGNGKNIENHNSKSLHSHSRTKSLKGCVKTQPFFICDRLTIPTKLLWLFEFALPFFLFYRVCDRDLCPIVK